jgi:hypothetical protein
MVLQYVFFWEDFIYVCYAHFNNSISLLIQIIKIHLWGVRAGRIVYSRPHVACSSFPYIHSTMRSVSGAWRVGWSAAWSVDRDLVLDEESVAAAAE